MAEAEDPNSSSSTNNKEGDNYQPMFQISDPVRLFSMWQYRIVVVSLRSNLSYHPHSSLDSKYNHRLGRFVQ